MSVDGVTEALQAVKRGTLAGTISQYPYAEGEMAVQACHKLYTGGTIDQQFTAPIKLITQDNANQAINSFPRPFFKFKDPFGAP